MARQILWKRKTTALRDAIVVAEPEVGNYCLVYADGVLYKASKGGTGSSVWEGTDDLYVESVTATGNITSTTGNIVATTGTVIALAGDISAPAGAATALTVVANTTVTAGTDTVTPKLNGYPVNTAALALTELATIATVATSNNVFSVTITANRILGNPTGLVRGGWYSWEITQGGVGSFELTYGNLFKFRGGAPALTNAAGSVDVLFGYYNGTVLIMDVWLDVKA